MIKYLTVIIMCLSTLNVYANPETVAERTSKDFTAVAKKAIPAVVSITVKMTARQTELDDFFQNDIFQQFFSIPRRGNEARQVLGQGSGFIVKPDGYILTNAHVIADATEISVRLHDGRVFEGKVIGKDTKTDVGLIKIEATGLPYIEFADSDKIEIGQWAIAIGNPLGLRASLTVGVISAKELHDLDLASVEEQDFLQTDAAINKGNSGGPLLNIDGYVMGINTAIATNALSGGYLGLGFAVPSNIAKHILDQLLTTGKVTRGYVGLRLQTIDHDLAQALSMKQVTGTLVSEVAKGSPAEKAGIKQGDVILSYNNKPVASNSALRKAITLMPPGTHVTLQVLRNGATLDIPIEVATYPTSESQQADVSGSQLGFDVQDITPDLAHTLGLSEEVGVVISKVSPNSAAAWSGLKRGAVILAVNQKKVSSVAQFQTAIQETPKGRPVLLLVKQGEAIRFLSLKLN